MTVELDGVSADATALPDAGPAAAPAAPEAAPQSELTTRDIIRAAVERQKAGEDSPAEPAPRSDGRAADGRFAPAATHGADGKPLAPGAAPAVDPNAPPVDAAPGVGRNGGPPLNAPGYLSPESKAVWAALPPHVQADLVKREQAVSDGFRQYEGLGSYAKMAKESGTNLATAFKNYAEMDAGLGRDFNTGVESICKWYGKDPRELAVAIATKYGLIKGQAPALAPLPKTIDEDALVERAAQRIRDEHASRQVDESLSSFKADAANRYYENVREHMASLIEAGHAETLKDAYDMACWARPDIRALLLKQQAAPAPSPNAAPALKAAAAAKHVLGAPRAGLTPAAKPHDENATLRDTIRNAVVAQRAVGRA
jgi:hypothetical protein